MISCACAGRTVNSVAAMSACVTAAIVCLVLMCSIPVVVLMRIYLCGSAIFATLATSNSSLATP